MPEPTPPNYVIENDEQYEAARAATSAYEQEQIERRRQERDQHLAPLRAVVNDPAYADLLARLSPLVTTYVADPSINIHLGPIPGFLTRLKLAAV